jgi:hypothetical protein
MILRLQVTKVIPGSYVKGDKTIETLDLLCMDLGDGRRLSHGVLFAPDRAQRAAVEAVDLRDKVIAVDVEEVRTNYAGAVVFRGFIDPASLPAADGKLKVERPATPAPAK